jgi:hypothetical protein
VWPLRRVSAGWVWVLSFKTVEIRSIEVHRKLSCAVMILCCKRLPPAAEGADEEEDALLVVVADAVVEEDRCGAAVILWRNVCKADWSKSTDWGNITA